MNRADLLVLDGSHLLWRAAEAFMELHYIDDAGEQVDTGAIYGFLTTAMRIHERWGGVVAVAWDGNRSTNFRKKLFPEYKLHKEVAAAEATVEEMALKSSMRDQERRLRELLVHVGIRQYVADECEGDDVMGVLAARFGREGSHVVLYTGDSDIRQLVNEHVSVVSPQMRPGRPTEDVAYDVAAVVARYGIARPDQIADLKALAGDTGDGIPGMNGIGEKKAVKLLALYDDVEGVIKAALASDEGWPIGEKLRLEVANNAATLRLYKQLTTIKRDAKMIKLPAAQDKATVVEKFKRWRFHSLLAPMEMGAVLGMGSARVVGA